MRKIDVQNFSRATRDTPRDINRRIILNLLREHGPVSRAALARLMEVPRGMITSLVNELLDSGLIFEGATTSAPRGRRPTLLHLRSHDRLVVGVNIRASRTVLQLTDFGGEELARDSFDTPSEPSDFVRLLAERIGLLLAPGDREGDCEGIGIVVPGMVHRHTGRILNAPTLGWEDVDVKAAIEAATGLPTQLERDAVACALARMWNSDLPGEQTQNFVYMIVSEGVGTGLVLNSQPVWGHNYTAGEFGHVPIDVDGPVCSCGSTGCLEAYTSDVATVARYLGFDFEGRSTAVQVKESGLGITDVVARGKAGDQAALAALRETGTWLGVGIAGIIKSLDPERIVIGGEITAGWDLVKPWVDRAIEERALIHGTDGTIIETDPTPSETYLRGASALVVAPAFAAPSIA